tara:strand:+ start:1457 stop:2380 length:924 start_codon:yes stop_codon:yes gene_type:complete
MILNDEQIREIIDVKKCIPVMEELFSNLDNTYMPPKVYLPLPKGDFRSMPAIVGDSVGIKWCGVHVENGKCDIFAKIMLNEVSTGKLLAIMDGCYITSVRTAAVTGLATKYMAPEDAKVAAFIGCGTQTPRQIEAVCAVRDIQRISVFDLDRQAMFKIASQVSHLGIEVHPTMDLDHCVRDADIITTLTPARGEGFIEHSSLKDVVHVNAIGADAEGKRELKDSCLANMGVIAYDEWEQCSHSGEIQYVGDMEQHGVLLSLGHIVNNNFARENQTVFDATGLAIEDVATARYIYDKVINDNGDGAIS